MVACGPFSKLQKKTFKMRLSEVKLGVFLPSLHACVIVITLFLDLN